MSSQPDIKSSELDNMIIRPFRDSDVDTLIEIQKSTWQNFYAGILPEKAVDSLVNSGLKEKWEQRMHYPMPPLHIADLDGTLIGSVCYGPSLACDLTKNTQLYSLYVHPDYWGRGIVGNALIEHVKDWCKGKDTQAIEGWVSPENEFVDSFLKEKGFRRTNQKRIVMHGGVPLEEVLYVLTVQ